MYLIDNNINIKYICIFIYLLNEVSEYIFTEFVELFLLSFFGLFKLYVANKFLTSSLSKGKLPIRMVSHRKCTSKYSRKNSESLCSSKQEEKCNKVNNAIIVIS